MKRHLTTHELFGFDEDEMAHKLSELRYDSLSKLLQAFSLKVGKDGLADERRRRPQLARHLLNGAAALATTADEFKAAWKLCEPHMP